MLVQGLGQAGEYDVQVCRCGAECIVTWKHSSFTEEPFTRKHITIYRKWSAWLHLRNSFPSSWQEWYDLRFNIKKNRPQERYYDD